MSNPFMEQRMGMLDDSNSVEVEDPISKRRGRVALSTKGAAIQRPDTFGDHTPGTSPAGPSPVPNHDGTFTLPNMRTMEIYGNPSMNNLQVLNSQRRATRRPDLFGPMINPSYPIGPDALENSDGSITIPIGTVRGVDRPWMNNLETIEARQLRTDHINSQLQRHGNRKVATANRLEQMRDEGGTLIGIAPDVVTYETNRTCNITDEGICYERVPYGTPGAVSHGQKTLPSIDVSGTVGVEAGAEAGGTVNLLVMRGDGKIHTSAQVEGSVIRNGGVYTIPTSYIESDGSPRVVYAPVVPNSVR